MTSGPDLIDEWAQAQARVIALVAPLTTGQAATRVPACPDWTVRDLFSHMVGLGADVVAGDEPDDHNAVWTENQIATRRDHDVAALVTECEYGRKPRCTAFAVYDGRSTPRYTNSTHSSSIA